MPEVALGVSMAGLNKSWEEAEITPAQKTKGPQRSKAA